MIDFSEMRSTKFILSDLPSAFYDSLAAQEIPSLFPEVRFTVVYTSLCTGAFESGSQFHTLYF
jgi:hypothetical protein